MSEPKPEEAAANFSEALAALRDANAGAVAAIRATQSPQQAFERATELADLLRDMAEAGAEVRAETVVLIYKGESLSLAGLAGRIGVSKARAGQLIQTAKKNQGQS